jgi:hypothetical protein
MTISLADNPLQGTIASAIIMVGPVQWNKIGFQDGGPEDTTSGIKNTRPKTGCWTCGEPHYQCGCPVERERAIESTGHTTVVNMGKAHRIHDRDE